MQVAWSAQDQVWLVITVLGSLAAAVTPLLASVWSTGESAGRAAEPVEVTVEDLALAAGGPARLVRAGVGRLVEDGFLRVEADRRLYPTAGAVAPDDPLGRAVMARVAAKGTPLGRVVRSVRGGPPVTAAIRSAVDRRLLHDPWVMRRWRRGAQLALVAVLISGIVRLAAPDPGTRGATIVVMVFALLLLAAGQYVWFPTWELSGTTRAVNDALAAARDAVNPSPWLPGDRSRTEVVLPAMAGAFALVAVGGLRAYPDAGVAALLGESDRAGAPGLVARLSDGSIGGRLDGSGWGGGADGGGGGGDGGGGGGGDGGGGGT